MIALRWIAVALAMAGVLDPRVALPHRGRPPIRLIASDHEPSLEARLRAAGFAVGAADDAATVVTPGATIAARELSGPIYLLARDAAARIERVSAPVTRVAGQALVVTATLHGRGARGQKTTIQLEDGGVAVAAATHTWSGEDETWDAALSYLPVGAGAARLRVRAATAAEVSTVTVLAPALRGPIRTLVYDPAVTWGTVFVRRALEDQPGFTVASVQRATKGTAIRAGAPPASLTRAGLAPYEVIVCGRLDGVDAASLGAIRWFVEERGGVLVFVPDRALDRAPSLLSGVTFESKVLDAAVVLHGVADGLSASELAMPRGTGPIAGTLAADAAGEPVVVAIRRGLGAVVISGALDAWRYRDRDQAAFARFWPTVLIAQAAAVPPRLAVNAEPSAARPGDTVHVRVRLRATELPTGDRVPIAPIAARAIEPSTRTETPVRLWPTAEPGVYEGEWRPARAGRYVIDASAGDAAGAAIVEVAAEVAPDPSVDAALRVAATVSGGGVFADEASLVAALSNHIAPVTTSEPRRPARSPWWAAAFAACLCAEWAARRRRGLP